LFVPNGDIEPLLGIQDRCVYSVLRFTIIISGL